jgi:hypothetical protein
MLCDAAADPPSNGHAVTTTGEALAMGRHLVLDVAQAGRFAAKDLRQSTSSRCASHAAPRGDAAVSAVCAMPRCAAHMVVPRWQANEVEAGMWRISW